MIVTVEFRGIDVAVEGNYIPEEPPIPYDTNMEGYPGYRECFEVEEMFIENTKVFDLLEEHLDEIEKLVLEKLKE